MQKVVYATQLLPQKEGILEINYTQIVGENLENLLKDEYLQLKTFFYYLAPAKLWKSYDKLNISINTPKKYSLTNKNFTYKILIIKKYILLITIKYPQMSYGLI